MTLAASDPLATRRALVAAWHALDVGEPIDLPSAEPVRELAIRFDLSGWCVAGTNAPAAAGEGPSEVQRAAIVADDSRWFAAGDELLEARGALESLVRLGAWRHLPLRLSIGPGTWLPRHPADPWRIGDADVIGTLVGAEVAPRDDKFGVVVRAEIRSTPRAKRAGRILRFADAAGALDLANRREDDEDSRTHYVGASFVHTTLGRTHGDGRRELTVLEFAALDLVSSPAWCTSIHLEEPAR